LFVRSATAMFSIIVPSTAFAVVPVSRAASVANPRLMSGGRSRSARR
jgi:hypothetical protein